MILYSIICACFSFGCIMQHNDKNPNDKFHIVETIFIVLFSFVIVPVYIGYLIEKTTTK